MGLNLTTAVTIFAKTLVKEQKFPFEITADPFYSAENQAYLKKAIAALESKQGETHELIND
ncbi:type II toxin-antitoxin system RelB/DinJ family antitoxin [Loigolactobacillus coryniformis]|nr:hypothetical protein [Loigolactobacillus coryniformis]